MYPAAQISKFQISNRTPYFNLIFVPSPQFFIFNSRKVQFQQFHHIFLLKPCPLRRFTNQYMIGIRAQSLFSSSQEKTVNVY